MDILTIKEVALYLKCSASSIRALVREKRIPFFRIGAKLNFSKASIDAWMKKQEELNMQSIDNLNVKSIRRWLKCTE